MLKIRLQRVGRKHEPVFRLVLTDSKNSTKSGKSLEILGNYDSRSGEKAVFKNERISYWMSKGAQASPTVHNLLVTRNIVSGKKINNLPKKRPIKKEGTDIPVENTAEKEAVKEESVKVPEEVKVSASDEKAEETLSETPDKEVPESSSQEAQEATSEEKTEEVKELS